MYTRDNFLCKEDCEHVINIIDIQSLSSNHHVWLEKHDELMNTIRLKLIQHDIPFQVVGDKVTLGKYTFGQYLGKHSDQSYQGGDHSLLIYLNDVAVGGETVFYDELDTITHTISPREGKLIIFDVNDMHESTPVVSNTKYIIGCEVQHLDT